MICPLKFASKAGNNYPEFKDFDHEKDNSFKCHESGCAWWATIAGEHDTSESGCALRILAEGIKHD